MLQKCNKKVNKTRKSFFRKYKYKKSLKYKIQALYFFIKKI